MKIGIVVGSIREGRKGGAVGSWLLELAKTRTDASYELVDLKQFDVPLLTSSVHPAAANREYDSPAVRVWSSAIDACDGFVFVTAEYNHGVPGAFKNAVDSLGPEWSSKAVSFAGYGSIGAVRAIEQWRQILANFQMVDLREQVSLSTFDDFDEGGSVKANDRKNQSVHRMLDQLEAEVILRSSEGRK